MVLYINCFAYCGHVINYVKHIFLQLLKPIYEGCMEKGVQHVATHATAAALGTTASPSGSANRSSHANGKVKHSWGYANNNDPSHQQNHQPHHPQSQHQKKNFSTTTLNGANCISSVNNNNNNLSVVAGLKKRKKSKKSVPKK